MFRKAAERALRKPSRCAVIVFDEVDGLGLSRALMGSGPGEDRARRVLAELCLQLTFVTSRKLFSPRDFDNPPDAGLASDDAKADDSKKPSPPLARIIVAAATSRMDDVDPALLRRFGIKMEVGLPSLEDRTEMLARHIGSVPHNVSPEEFEKVAELTEEWSGSKLKDLAQEVTMRPVLECIEKADEVRRLAKMLERTGSLGDDSGQDGPRLSPDEAAHAELIENLQTLRAVTYDDFFWN